VKLLNSINATRRKRSERPIYIFVDLKKAYDSVDRETLMRILRKRSTNPNEEKIVRLIENSIRNQ
jgi:hypothetical protein